MAPASTKRNRTTNRIGWMVRKTSISGTRGTEMRLYFVTTHASLTAQARRLRLMRSPLPSARHPGSHGGGRVSRPAPLLLDLLGRAPGKREEDVVERGATQADVGDVDRAGVENAHRVHERARAGSNRHPNGGGVRVDHNLAVGDRLQRLGRTRSVVARRRRDLDALTAHPRLQFRRGPL